MDGLEWVIEEADFKTLKSPKKTLKKTGPKIDPKNVFYMTNVSHISKSRFMNSEMVSEF